MEKLPEIAFDQLKKLKVLSIIRDRGEDEALHLYPEFEYFIYWCRDKRYEDAKAQVLRDSSYDLVLH